MGLTRVFGNAATTRSISFPAPLTCELEMGLGWHDRTDTDLGCRFFRQLVVRALAIREGRAATLDR
jgi:hypothetical protein